MSTKANLFLIFGIFLFFSVGASADDYEDLLVKQANEFLKIEYNLTEPVDPKTLIQNWKQIEGIDKLTYLYKEDINTFRRTTAKPYMLHKWSSISMPYEMLNYKDPLVSALARMVGTYRYFLRARLDDGNGHSYQGDVYSEVESMVIFSGGKLARIIDKKYTAGKLIPSENDEVLWKNN